MKSAKLSSMVMEPNRRLGGTQIASGAFAGRILCLYMFLALETTAHAHRDFEWAAGEFVREDGERVQIVVRTADGMVLRDPISYRLRQMDGQEMARTPLSSEILVHRRGPKLLEFDEYGAFTAPFPEQVELFDGYRMRKVDGFRTGLRAVLRYFQAHWLGHALFFCATAYYVIKPTFHRRVWGTVGDSLLRAAEWGAGLTLLGTMLLASQGYLSEWVLLLIFAGVSTGMFLQGRKPVQPADE